MEIVSSFLKENAPIVAPLSGSSERKQSDGVSRCFEINCPHSEELFNESIQFSSTAKRGNNPRLNSRNSSDSNYSRMDATRA